MPVNVGIVGLGSAGTTAARAVDRYNRAIGADRLRLVGGSDLDDEAAAHFGARHGIPTYRSVDELCERQDVDVVVVSTPNPAHATCAIEALRCGAHVLVEKPIATTLEEADAIVAAAAATDHVALAVHTPAFHPVTARIREVLAGGELGRLAQVCSLLHTPWLERPRSPDELRPDRGGGVAFRQAPHQVDLVRSLVPSDPVVAVHARTTRTTDGGVDATYVALLGFASGAGAVLAYNGLGFFDTSELTWGLGMTGRPREPGAGNRLRALGFATRPKTVAVMEEAARIEHGRRPGEVQGHPFYGFLTVSCEGGDILQTPRGIGIHSTGGYREEVVVPWHGPLVAELGHLVGVVAGEEEPVFDVVWGRDTLAVCLDIVGSVAWRSGALDDPRARVGAVAGEDR